MPPQSRWEQMEEEFNRWNRSRTTGLTRDDLVPTIVSQDEEETCLTEINLDPNLESIKANRRKKKKRNLANLLRKLP